MMMFGGDFNSGTCNRGRVELPKEVAQPIVVPQPAQIVQPAQVAQPAQQVAAQPVQQTVQQVRYVDTVVQPGQQVVYKQAPPAYVQNLRDVYYYDDYEMYGMPAYGFQNPYIRGGRVFFG
ncbi:Oidioi.mRNA.OKI2018_I69.chr1.g2531.t1.cds [Oikopleura dioica]|uniref:Oidioi.mRNA.OKI2018_I69.chr1.g2531.t1.cds n=1 Tax=Oikopleura dioica TaxID=34765 RepID=A0ABN7SRC2_OIKDI|nr:Oidioi.mRNA.OKI2018_I69.chr1.g2531.t1.cds [Oikopleura dioica]